jgi:hypothetical protein
MIRTLLALLAAAFLVACPGPGPCPVPPAPVVPDAGPAVGTQVTLALAEPALGATATPTSATIYVAFGADSAVTSATWASWCTPDGALNCSFVLTGEKQLDLGGAYLNATFSSGMPVGCGATKTEINANNPSWYDTYDVSLVDGFNRPAEIRYTAPGAKEPEIFAALAATGNEKAVGVFPAGCDICVQRQSPPCGIAPGPVNGDGCKAGTQYDPSPVCQFQSPVKGGGGAVTAVFWP